eukprot:gene1985-2165_t
MIRFIGREQIKSVGRKAQLSVLSAAEEFSAKPLPARSVRAAIFGQTKLDGGVQVLTHDVDSSTVSLRFAVLGGSSTETATQKGASQLLAAAAYAGNKKNSGLRIVRFLESLGAEFSATADREKIVYDITVLPDRVEPAIAAIVSAISSPPHAPYVFEESRGNVKLNYEKLNGQCGFQLSELVLEAAFGEGSPLGTPLFGNLAGPSVEEALAYRTAHFVQENVVVAGSGISQDRLKALLALHVARIPGAAGKVQQAPEFNYVGGDLKVRADLDGASQLALSFPISSGVNGNAYRILANALSATFAKKQICATPFVQTFSKGGLLGLKAWGPAATATKNLQAAVGELKVLANGGDFASSRNKVALDNLRAFEGNAAGQLVEAYLQKADALALADARKVTDKEVAEASAKLLNSKPTYVVYGATAGTPNSSQSLLA